MGLRWPNFIQIDQEMVSTRPLFGGRGAWKWRLREGEIRAAGRPFGHLGLGPVGLAKPAGLGGTGGLSGLDLIKVG